MIVERSSEATQHFAQKLQGCKTLCSLLFEGSWCSRFCPRPGLPASQRGTKLGWTRSRAPHATPDSRSPQTHVFLRPHGCIARMQRACCAGRTHDNFPRNTPNRWLKHGHHRHKRAALGGGSAGAVTSRHSGRRLAPHYVPKQGLLRSWTCYIKKGLQLNHTAALLAWPSGALSCGNACEEESATRLVLSWILAACRRRQR